MRELLAYLASVILLPAVAAALIASPAMFGGLRRRAAVVDACIAVGLAAAFLIAFIHEVEPNALLRQLPVELPGDDAPFERWHRVALVALLLALVSPILALAAAWRPTARSAEAAWMALVAGVLVAMPVEFPGATGMTRVMTGATCAAGAFMLSRVGGVAALKARDFFQDLDWHAVLACKYDPPIRPATPAASSSSSSFADDQLPRGLCGPVPVAFGD